MKKHIKRKPKNHDHINHLALRSDFESNNIYDTFLQREGKICNDPETWGIVCTISDKTIVENYLYESKLEYEQDCKLLKL